MGFKTTKYIYLLDKMSMNRLNIFSNKMEDFYKVSKAGGHQKGRCYWKLRRKAWIELPDTNYKISFKKKTIIFFVIEYFYSPLPSLYISLR